GSAKKGGSMQLWNQDEYQKQNAGQLDDNGGGQIPPSTEKHPEYFGPEKDGQSLIYRWDEKSGKNVVVGWRKNDQCHYFQSTATMNEVNKQAADGGLTPPRPPLSSPSDSPPPGNGFDGGYLEVTNRAAGTNQEYVWRWDTKAGRYCAVGERPAPGKDGGTHYCSPTAY